MNFYYITYAPYLPITSLLPPYYLLITKKQLKIKK